MLEVIKVINYTISLYGNKRILPYGDLVITNGEQTKTCAIKEDSNGLQYITL